MLSKILERLFALNYYLKSASERRDRQDTVGAQPSGAASAYPEIRAGG